MKIGILAVQGAFVEHERALESLGCDCVELRERADVEALETFDGLVFPGGESTAQGKMLRQLGMFEPILAALRAGTPVLATCAGLILLAEKLENDSNVYFGTLPVVVRRNAYGRQLGSFRRRVEFSGLGGFSATFIRAPVVTDAAPGVETLATVDGGIVAVRFENQLGLTFHPELGGDARIHRLFLEMIESRGAAV